MTVYVYRDGAVVPKGVVEPRKFAKSANLRTPNVSRFEAYESPVTGQTVSSDRQRELDLFKSNSYDGRDIGPNHSFAKAREARKEQNASRSAGPEQLQFWRD